MKTHRITQFIVLLLCVAHLLSCSKVARDSAKLSKKDGIWEIQSMSISYQNNMGEQVTENYKDNGFFLLYNAKWYQHSIDMWDRYYGEVKITDMVNQPYDIIKVFNWYVEGDKLLVFEGQNMDATIREYSFEKKGDKMTLYYEGENNFFYSFIEEGTTIQETFNLKRYDF